jgi:hypothetical protein
MIGLIQGRDVHYVDTDGEHMAAKIVRITDPSRAIINLFVFPVRAGEEGGVIENVPFRKSTAANPTSNPRSWHWIERVGPVTAPQEQTS